MSHPVVGKRAQAAPHTIWSEHKMMMTPLLAKKWSLLLPHNCGRDILEIFTSFSGRRREEQRPELSSQLAFGAMVIRPKWKKPTDILIVKTSYYTCPIPAARWLGWAISQPLPCMGSFALSLPNPNVAGTAVKE